MLGTVHYFSDSSDAADADDDDAASQDEALDQGEEFAVLMAAVEMGSKTAVATCSGGEGASSFGQAVSVGSVQIVGDDATDGMAISATVSPVKPSASSAPLSQFLEPPQKSAALALPPPPSSYAPSARMCSSIVMKALPPTRTRNNIEPAVTH
jgi:hypothetical protein